MINATLAKDVSSLIKRTWKGAVCRTGYVGTGSRWNRRQLFVRLPSGFAIDLWFEEDEIRLGGVMRTNTARVFHLNDEPVSDCAKRVLGELARYSLPKA
ncbi:MAG: hypothetical protein WC761_00160 [Candidatus Paceibacterota bacterium]|jgi:hypothetical protein